MCFIGNITHHTSVGRGDESTVDRKKAAAEESLGEERVVNVNAPVKVLLSAGCL